MTVAVIVLLNAGTVTVYDPSDDTVVGYDKSSYVLPATTTLANCFESMVTTSLVPAGANCRVPGGSVACVTAYALPVLVAGLFVSIVFSVVTSSSPQPETSTARPTIKTVRLVGT